MSKHTLLLGAHMSISGGFDQAIYRGELIGCTAIQIFTKSNRQWNAKPITKSDIQLFRDAWEKSSIKNIVAHASYLINIATPEKATRDKSVSALIQELERCHMLGIPGLILHPGTRGKAPEQESLDQVALMLDEALSQTPHSTEIYLEIMAGQGSSVCTSLENLAYIIKKTTHKKRLGVCIDTCHAFAAGYDLRTSISYEKFWKSFDDLIGFSYLKTIHLNDSKKELGSRVDRHEEIGEGKLGVETFKLIMNDSRLRDVPKILETPNIENYLKTMQILVSLIARENKKNLTICVADGIKTE